VLAAAATVWCVSIAAAPVLGLNAVYQLFSIICHQDPARTLHILGEPFAVCIRCTSIYFGFLAGLLFLHAPRVNGLRIAIALTLIEFTFARIVADVAIIRALTGLLLGGMAAPFVRIGIEQMLRKEARETV
jgi:uncharacterized membrane protein